MAPDLDAQMEEVRRAAEVSMSQRAVAERLGHSLSAVRQAVWDGRIRAVHLTSSVRIPLAEVERLEALGPGVSLRQAQDHTDGPPEAA